MMILGMMLNIGTLGKSIIDKNEINNNKLKFNLLELELFSFLDKLFSLS